MNKKKEKLSLEGIKTANEKMQYAIIRLSPKGKYVNLSFLKKLTK